MASLILTLTTAHGSPGIPTTIKTMGVNMNHRCLPKGDLIIQIRSTIILMVVEVYVFLVSKRFPILGCPRKFL